MDYSEYFDGALRFNTLFMCINVLLIIIFFYSWRRSYKRTGWTIDFWHVTLFLNYFLTFLLMYPFSTAQLNALVISERNLMIVRRAIDSAYVISLTGYMSIFLGGAIFRYYGQATPIYWFLIRPVRHTIGELYSRLVINRKVARTVFLFYFGALLTSLFFAYRAGMLNDPRGFYAQNEQVRFLFNFVNSLSGIVSSFLVVRIMQFNLRSDKLLLVLFLLVTVFIGSRGGIIGPLIGFFTAYVYYRKQGRVKIGKVLFFALAVLVLIMALSFFRAGEFSVSVILSAFSLQVFYGNSFSDLRDFSWILSLWDGAHFYGKTYLAAFMSFIPSSISEFRYQWSIGKVTAVMAGYSPKEHPGLRPGMFGESYFNFGILGVILLGILLGYAWKYVDYNIKKYAYTDYKIGGFVASASTILIGALPITAGFFGIYVMIVVYTCLYLYKLFLNVYKKTTA